jgi:hypothetical protein
MAILTYHTHIEDVDVALLVIEECVAVIRQSQNTNGV